MGDGAMFHVRQQILLADIGDVAAFGIFREQMVKWLVLGGPHRFWNGLIPFLAIGKNGVDIEHDTPEIKNTVAHDITDGELGFNDFGKGNFFNHATNIISMCPQINLVAWQSEKHRLMAPLCLRGAPVFRQ